MPWNESQSSCSVLRGLLFILWPILPHFPTHSLEKAASYSISVIFDYFTLYIYMCLHNIRNSGPGTSWTLQLSTRFGIHGWRTVKKNKMETSKQLSTVKSECLNWVLTIYSLVWNIIVHNIKPGNITLE